MTRENIEEQNEEQKVNDETVMEVKAGVNSSDVNVNQESASQNKELDGAKKDLVDLVENAISLMEKKMGEGKKPKKTGLAKIWNAFLNLFGLGEEEEEQGQEKDTELRDLLESLLEAFLALGKKKESGDMTLEDVQAVGKLSNDLEKVGAEQEVGSDIESILGDVLKELESVKQELNDLKEKVGREGKNELEPELENTPEQGPDQENDDISESEQDNERNSSVQDAISGVVNAISENSDEKGAFGNANGTNDREVIEATEGHNNKANGVGR